ncbi:MAG: hypothetical protein Q4A04_07720, partial [Eubacteriales bacterium]|nr:hypothetical protein [Eubacteriales bacterium]
QAKSTLSFSGVEFSFASEGSIPGPVTETFRVFIYFFLWYSHPVLLPRGRNGGALLSLQNVVPALSGSISGDI